MTDLSVKVKWRQKGTHLHLAIYVGPDADRACAGQLIVRPF